MLVLSRKTGEQLVIDNRIRVTINRIAGNRVTVGIEAPDDVHILRGELAPDQEQKAKRLSSRGRRQPMCSAG